MCIQRGKGEVQGWLSSWDGTDPVSRRPFMASISWWYHGGWEGWTAVLKPTREPLVRGEDFPVINSVMEAILLWQLKLDPPPPSQQTLYGWPLSPSRLCFHSSEPVISVSRSLRVGHGGTKTYLISGRAYCPNTVTILGKRKAWFLPRKRVRVKVQLRKKKEKKQTSDPNDGKPDSGVKNLLRET